MKQKLYLQLYFALLLSTLLCLLSVWVALRAFGEVGGPPGERMHHAATMLRAALSDVPDHELPARLKSLSADYGVELSAWDSRGNLLGSTLARAPRAPRNAGPRMVRERNGGLELVVPVDADRLVAVRAHYHAPRARPSLVGGFLLLAFVMAIGSYPVARRLTKRIENLADGVARWGAGDLAHRVAVEGKDEVATLAATFNRAAAQVNALVAQQRDTLANASHELRSPLARLQMALALVSDETSPERREELIENARKDIVDLDALIEDLLLLARADVRTPRRPLEPVQLSTLLASEAARVGASVTQGPELAVLGDALLLRHLIRNLLENAVRYGEGKPIHAELVANPEKVVLAVTDHGPGVPEHERERIFAPFYRLPGADRIAAGAGVGLSLVRQVARYHGGEARALAGADGGSRFEVELPRMPTDD